MIVPKSLSNKDGLRVYEYIRLLLIKAF